MKYYQIYPIKQSVNRHAHRNASSAVAVYRFVISIILYKPNPAHFKPFPGANRLQAENSAHCPIVLLYRMRSRYQTIKVKSHHAASPAAAINTSLRRKRARARELALANQKMPI